MQFKVNYSNINRLKFIIILGLIFCFFNINAQNYKWKYRKDWNPLMIAVYKENVNDIKTILKNDSIQISFNNYYNINAMEIAIRKKNIKIIDLLYTHKYYNTNKKNEIFLACIYGNKQVINYFYKKGIDFNDKNQVLISPLNIATKTRNTQIMLFLIEKGVNVNCQEDETLNTPLHYAVFNGNLKKVKILLEHGADKSIKNKEGKRAYDMVDEIYPYLHISKRKKAKLKKLLE